MLSLPFLLLLTALVVLCCAVLIAWFSPWSYDYLHPAEPEYTKQRTLNKARHLSIPAAALDIDPEWCVRGCVCVCACVCVFVCFVQAAVAAIKAVSGLTYREGPGAEVCAHILSLCQCHGCTAWS